MKLQVLLLIALAAGLAACAEKEQVAAPTESETEAPETVAAEVSETMDAVEDEIMDDPDATLADVQEWRTEALLDHMHAHAEQLDDLNYALDDGDLFRASTSAYWLSRHEVISGLPDRLQPHVMSLRNAARAVEAAEDIETAKAAAKDVGAACQACHEAAEVSVD
ncbi:MAG: hypothetical protein QNJ14_10360 [Woeseiaceae bacterium]|nr:hypothetical protein [Woeseiaceae bacterium]